MQKAKKKPKWAKPKLIILERSRSGERVLDICKGVGFFGPGMGDCNAGFQEFCAENDPS